MRALFLSTALIATACASAQADPLNLDPAIQFEASLSSLTPAFDRLCDTYDVRTLDPAELPIAQSSHVQIDCHGFDHAGASRLAEFVFADDALAFIWVLTEADEEAAHLARMRERYGAPSHDTPLFVAFTDDRTALRRDIPEFLYYGDHIAPVYQGWFDQMATQAGE
ncbi:MAG: hypothetical protein GYB36_01600 [Alphaproteobacteria bacterium]|nr:hypothetical protein [Alphaproteobacteria bacterium]